MVHMRYNSLIKLMLETAPNGCSAKDAREIIKLMCEAALNNYFKPSPSFNAGFVRSTAQENLMEKIGLNSDSFNTIEQYLLKLVGTTVDGKYYNLITVTLTEDGIITFNDEGDSRLFGFDDADETELDEYAEIDRLIDSLGSVDEEMKKREDFSALFSMDSPEFVAKDITNTRHGISYERIDENKLSIMNDKEKLELYSTNYHLIVSSELDPSEYYELYARVHGEEIRSCLSLACLPGFSQEKLRAQEQLNRFYLKCPAAVEIVQESIIAGIYKE